MYRFQKISRGIHLLHLPGLLILLLLLAGCKSPGNEISTQAEDGWQTSGIAQSSSSENGNAAGAVVPDAGIPPAGSRDLPADAYSPDCITVIFRSGITSQELQAAGIPLVPGAASQARNAKLRQDPACEYLASEIALRHGLEIRNQVYVGRTRLAGFRLPAAMDREGLLASLRTEFGSFILDCAPSQLGQPCFRPDDPDFRMSGKQLGPQWQLHRMDFPRAWDRTQGAAEIVIATLDSGANLSHEELAGRIIDPAVEFPELTFDLVNNDNTLEDEHGHGTAMAGLISAATDNARSVAGAAPGSRQLVIKLTGNWGGDFTIDNVIEAGYLAQAAGADIVSMSFTIWEASPAVRTMLQDLAAAGMLMFAAAGNSADDVRKYPGSFSEVVSVGATDENDRRCSFSNFADTVELAAPGQDIRICGNQFDSGALAYSTQFGTSLSTPLAAAAAALLWSVRPELDAAQVRALLAYSGKPADGFGRAVPRVDIGALLNDYSGAVLLPQLPGCIVSGSLAITGQAIEDPPHAGLSLDGQLLQSLDSAPWKFSAATDSVLLGPGLLELHSGTMEQPQLDAALLFVDNTAGCYPLVDEVPGGSGLLRWYDAGQAQHAVRVALEQQGAADWTDGLVASRGQGRWQRMADASVPGSGEAWYCGMADKLDYDDYEFDCLLSCRINLQEATAPVLRFSERVNLQDGGSGYDRLSVQASTDDGASWELLATESQPGWFTGYQPDWQVQEIPLDAFIGESVHICFSLQSNSDISGAKAGEARGAWLSGIYIGEPDNSGQAAFSLLDSPAGKSFGKVPGQGSILVQCSGNPQLDKLEFRLDCRPFGNSAGGDLSAGPTASSGVSFSLGSTQRPNQQAWLSIQAYDAAGLPGQSMLLPLYIFNMPGDANADGYVDSLDTAAIVSALGSTPAAAGWSPFLDSDQDGAVTERDAAAIGYYWHPADE